MNGILARLLGAAMMTMGLSLVFYALGPSEWPATAPTYDAGRSYFHLGLLLLGVGLVWLMLYWATTRMENLLEAYRLGYRHGRADSASFIADLEDAFKDGDDVDPAAA